MSTFARVVADTNVLVSRLILPESVPAQVLRQVELNSLLLFSESTMNELADVLSRQKFDRYVSLNDRKGFVERLGKIAEFIPIVQLVRECSDPKDDKFLEVALNGSADMITTGDTDLLAMNLWRGVEILSPANCLKRAL